MNHSTVLITGINGELGHALSAALARDGYALVGLDLQPARSAIAPRLTDFVQGSVLDRDLLSRVLSDHDIDAVYHLAAMLSTRAETSPYEAHEVNVTGTLHLLHVAADHASSSGKRIPFFFPSSIAVYGMPQRQAGGSSPAPVREDEHCSPRTMYGCNKLYGEQLGVYFADPFSGGGRLDFRALRFPGLISAETMPSGGTTDYASEMLHAAAHGLPYACFVRPDLALPFMTMPDAVRATRLLMAAPPSALTRRIYNVGAFSPTADEIRRELSRHFPDSRITFAPDPKRQAIADGWPARVDDSAARRDWGWIPEHDFSAAFGRYLVPEVVGARITASL